MVTVVLIGLDPGSGRNRVGRRKLTEMKATLPAAAICRSLERIRHRAVQQLQSVEASDVSRLGNALHSRQA